MGDVVTLGIKFKGLKIEIKVKINRSWRKKNLEVKRITELTINITRILIILRNSKL